MGNDGNRFVEVGIKGHAEGLDPLHAVLFERPPQVAQGQLYAAIE